MITPGSNQYCINIRHEACNKSMVAKAPRQNLVALSFDKDITMKDKKFVEVVDISSNHTIVVGTVGKGKRSDMFKQLLREEENNEIPEPLIGDRVISTDELIHSDRTKY